MTQLTKAALGTQVSTLAADNTAGDISAADLRSLLTDTADSLVGGPASATDNTIPRYDGTTGQLIQGSGIVIADTTNDVSIIGNITPTTGSALRTATTATNTILLQAYDVDGVAYSTFATLTANNAPALAIAAPVGGTVTIDGAVIGGVTAAAGSFTTLAASGDVAVATNKFTVASASGNTLVAGTLNVTSDVAVATNKFTVAAASGNTLVAGTLNVTSDVAVATNKFTVAAATGNTVVAGTLGVTGLTSVVDVTSSGYARKSVGNALTATGTTRADALQLAKQINNVTTVAAGTGVILPAGAVGDIIIVENAGANIAKVYASGADTIDGVAGATGVNLTNAKRCMYICVAANTIISAQLGVISA